MKNNLSLIFIISDSIQISKIFQEIQGYCKYTLKYSKEVIPFAHPGISDSVKL